MLVCSYCGSSHYVKYGKKDGKQVYKCKTCNRKFIDNLRKRSLRLLCFKEAQRLNKKGKSLREISKEIKRKYKYNVEHTTIMHWLKRGINEERQIPISYQTNGIDDFLTLDTMVKIKKVEDSRIKELLILINNEWVRFEVK